MQTPLSSTAIQEPRPSTLFLETLKQEAQALLDFAHKHSSPPLQNNINTLCLVLYQTLKSGGKILVSGIGKSGKIAQKISATFVSTGSHSLYIHPTEALHGDLGSTHAGDIALILSQTGNTEEIVKFTSALKTKQIKTIALCGNPGAKLLQIADYWIDTSIVKEACPHNLAPTTSTTLALAIGDALAVALMELTGFKPDHFATNHPGGGLGNRLKLRVLDLMHKMSEVPELTEESSFEEVINASTQYKLGGVLITRGPQLLGIITDGDIRRAFLHKEKIFLLKAKDFMTPSPITVQHSQMALEALRLMENRKSQISVLPVLDEQQNCLGLIRLHDLLQTL